MKLLSLFIFTWLSSTLAHASFVKTTHDFGNFVPARETLSATFEYINRAETPVILVVTDPTTVLNRCTIASYTKEPIKKNFKGTLTVNCRFLDIGFNNKQVAKVQIRKGNTITEQALSVKGIVVESSACKPLDLNYEAPLNKMPALDQDGMGICYAFTASQMLEFQAKKNGLNLSISAIDASFISKYYDKQDTFQLDSGMPTNAIRNILKLGVASRECIDKVIAKHTKGTTLSSEEFLAIVEDVWIARRKNTTEAQIKADLKTTCHNYGISTAQFDKLLKELTVPFKVYLQEIFAECTDDRRKSKDLDDLDLELSVKVTGNNTQMVKFLDKLLDHKSPPALAMCAEILQNDPDHRGLTISGETRTVAMKDGKKDCGMHSVLVTARRKVGHSCEYLIRNSWGGTWAPKNMTCACKTPTAYYPDCSLNKEKGGNKVMVGCWVKEENLLPNTKNILGF